MVRNSPLTSAANPEGRARLSVGEGKAKSGPSADKQRCILGRNRFEGPRVTMCVLQGGGHCGNYGTLKSVDTAWNYFQKLAILWRDVLPKLFVIP